MKPILLLGESPGANEDRIKSSFVGASGIELLRMLDEAEILTLTACDRDYLRGFYNTGDPLQLEMIWRLHPEVHRTNVFSTHPLANDLTHFCGPREGAIRGWPALTKAKYCRAEFVPDLERLDNEIHTLAPNLIVALGNTPLWALCGTTGISKLRGTTRIATHIGAGFKLLPTYHPAAVIRQWELRPVTVFDLIKAKRESEFPDVRRPEREIWIEPGLDDIRQYIQEFIRGCTILSVDIETRGSRITCIGFAPSARSALVIPFDDDRRKGRSYWQVKEAESACWCLVRGILEDPTIPKLFQNGLYDIAFLWRSMGIKTLGATHDTMLLHHALQPESLKSLGFLGSLYTDEGAWKTERKVATIKRDD